MGSTFSFFKGNVRILTICRIFFTMAQSLTWTLYPLYILALGGSEIEVGLIYALGALAGSILFPVGGYIADKKGRVKFVGLATLLFSISCVILTLAWSWQILAIGTVIRELFMFYMPAVNAIMADSIHRSQRGIGFATAMAIPGAVSITFTSIGGYLIDNVYAGNVIPAMRFFFGISIIVTFIVAIVRFKFLKETITENRLNFSLWNIKKLLKESYSSVIKTIKWMPQELRAVSIIMVLIVFFTSLAGPFWIVYATDIIGISLTEWSIILLIAGAFRIILAIPMGHLIDKFGPQKMMLYTSFIAPIPIILFTLTNSFVQLLGVFLLLAFFNTITWPLYSTLIAEYTPKEIRGRVLAILGQGIIINWGTPPIGGFILFIPATFGFLMGGFLYHYNNVYPWYILTFILTICPVLIFKFIKNPSKIDSKKLR